MSCNRRVRLALRGRLILDGVVATLVFTCLGRGHEVHLLVAYTLVVNKQPISFGGIRVCDVYSVDMVGVDCGLSQVLMMD